MNLGDKVMVTYKNGDQFVGRIKDETEKMWVIEFDDNDTRRIKKTMQIELVDDPETPEKEVVTEPTEPKRKSKVWAWIIAFLVVATAATVLGIFVF